MHTMSADIKNIPTSLVDLIFCLSWLEYSTFFSRISWGARILTSSSRHDLSQWIIWLLSSPTRPWKKQCFITFHGIEWAKADSNHSIYNNDIATNALYNSTALIHCGTIAWCYWYDTSGWLYLWQDLDLSSSFFMEQSILWQHSFIATLLLRHNHQSALSLLVMPNVLFINVYGVNLGKFDT